MRLLRGWKLMEFTLCSDGVKTKLSRAPATEAPGTALVPVLFKPSLHLPLQSTGVCISFLLKWPKPLFLAYSQIGLQVYRLVEQFHCRIFTKCPQTVDQPCCVRSAAQSCPTVCNSMDCSPSGSSVRGILQARIREWVAISSSRDQTCLSCISCIGHRFFPGQRLFIPLKGSVTETAPSLLGNRGAWLVWQIKFSTLYLHTVCSSFSPRREKVVIIKLGSLTSRIECLMRHLIQ